MFFYALFSSFHAKSNDKFLGKTCDVTRMNTNKKAAHMLWQVEGERLKIIFNCAKGAQE